MKKHKSTGNIQRLELKDIKQSKSESHLLKGFDKKNSLDDKETVTIDFEGDGPLGIYFINDDNNAVVNGIKMMTVADEYYNLEVGYIIYKINDIDCSNFRYKETLDLIGLTWNKFNKICIEFIKPELKIGIDENCPVYIFLKENKSEEYYQEFVDLGAVCLEDLEYIEYQDLINMNMKLENRRILHKVLKLNEKQKFQKTPSLVFTDIDDSETVDI